MSSSTRLLVLGVVRIFQPVHGYDVRRELSSWRADEWANVAPGSIYNALKSMTKDGLLEVVGTATVGGRPERTTYKLTGEGEKEFQRLLRETWWNVIPPLDAVSPGLAFMWVMTRDEMIAALEHRVAVIEGKLKEIEFSIQSYDDPQSKDQVREMLRLTSARTAAELPWARALIAKLKKGEYSFAAERAAAEAAKKGRAKRRG
ncbi:MAG TPA: PadR family transcriptional regulator [Kofleriaceae bacterium]|nr:PadR family transcriptional regulator [Kofleriaceae bacterium]